MQNATNQCPCQFYLDGDLTIYTANDTKNWLMPILGQCPHLEINLSNVSEMDSAGLQLLILAKRECQARDGDLRLVGHSKPVLEVLDLCNMHGYFGDPVYLSSQAQ